MLSLKDGGQIAETTFEAPLAYNGLAVANEQIIASLIDGSVIAVGR